MHIIRYILEFDVPMASRLAQQWWQQRWVRQPSLICPVVASHNHQYDAASWTDRLAGPSEIAAATQYSGSQVSLLKTPASVAGWLAGQARTEEAAATCMIVARVF
jgi:hypothetical protein